MRRLILFSTLFFLFCQKSPVGFEEMARGNLSHFQETLNPRDSLSFGIFYPCGNASFLFLGKNAKYESRVLFSFPINDSARENITKISLWLYTQDTTPYQFRIYPLTTQWSANATWRMAAPDIQWIHPGGDFLNLPIAEGRVVKDSFSLEVPLNLLDTILSTTGFILIPEENRDFNFASFKKTAKLIFTYGDKNRTFLSSFATYITNFLDTIPDSFIIGSGYVFRTYLSYPFSLGKENKIAEGEISLLLDPASSYFIRDTLEIAIFQLKENFWSRREKTEYYEIPIARKTVILPNDTLIRIPIKTLLENWQKEPEKNFGLYLSLYPQYQFPSYLTIKRDTLSFRINFTYIPPVKDRFP
ncbi:MAG: hypothetical protein ABIK99_01485 [candidate division WOR-3 bacterium]